MGTMGILIDNNPAWDHTVILQPISTSEIPSVPKKGTSQLGCGLNNQQELPNFDRTPAPRSLYTAPSSLRNWIFIPYYFLKLRLKRAGEDDWLADSTCIDSSHLQSSSSSSPAHVISRIRYSTGLELNSIWYSPIWLAHLLFFRSIGNYILYSTYFTLQYNTIHKMRSI